MDVARILQLRTMVDDPDFVREVGKLVCAVVGALKDRDLDMTHEVLDECDPALPSTSWTATTAPWTWRSCASTTLPTRG